jgi:hypothetical protein
MDTQEHPKSSQDPPP